MQYYVFSHQKITLCYLRIPRTQTDILHRYVLLNATSYTVERIKRNKYSGLCNSNGWTWPSIDIVFVYDCDKVLWTCSLQKHYQFCAYF